MMITLKDDGDEELTLMLDKVGAIECVENKSGDLQYQITINVWGIVYGLKYNTEQRRNKQYLILLKELEISIKEKK